MNDKNYQLAMIVRDDIHQPRKIYVRKEKGHDWRIVWIDTGHWFAVNSQTGQIRTNSQFRMLERQMHKLASRVKRNIINGLMLA